MEDKSFLDLLLEKRKNELPRVPSMLEILQRRKEFAEHLGAEEAVQKLNGLIQVLEKVSNNKLSEKDFSELLKQQEEAYKNWLDNKLNKEYKFNLKYIRETNKENMKKLLSEGVDE